MNHEDIMCVMPPSAGASDFTPKEEMSLVYAIASLCARRCTACLGPMTKGIHVLFYLCSQYHSHTTTEYAAVCNWALEDVCAGAKNLSDHIKFHGNHLQETALLLLSKLLLGW